MTDESTHGGIQVIGARTAVRNVLVVVDGSLTTAAAIDFAVTIGLRARAVLTILAFEMDPFRAFDAAMVAGACAVAPALPETHPTAYTIRRALERVPDGVSIRTKSASAACRKAVLRELESGDFDTLVLGCAVHGRLSGALLGVLTKRDVRRLRAAMVSQLPAADRFEREPGDVAESLVV